jgi:hypothetical protein
MGRKAWLVLLCLPACTLLTPVDGLSGGDMTALVDGSAVEGAVDARVAPIDADVLADADADADGSVDRSAAYRAAVTADMPLAYWRFEETSGIVAKDETGQHDGTYVLGPTLAVDGIIPGTRAMALPTGKNAHVVVPGSVFRFADNAAFTIELWALPKVFSDYQWLGGTENPRLPRSGWSVVVESAGIVSQEVWSAPADAASSTAVRFTPLAGMPLVLGRFQHVVFTFDGSTTSGYIDGSLVQAKSTPQGAPNTGALLWGCRLNDNVLDNCLDGWVLDEIAIYEHVLPAARVKAHHDLATAAAR